MSTRNRNAEHLYGYSSAEAVGQDITRLIVHPDDIPSLNSIIGNIFRGKCWRGNFPVKNKSGERFLWSPTQLLCTTTTAASWALSVYQRTREH